MATAQEELIKSPVETKEGELPQIDPPDYSDDEMTWMLNLRRRMENARVARDRAHDEYDGMDYATYYEMNERLANTFVKPKDNKQDTNFQSGTVRQKLFALLSALANLNLSGDISAFDDQGLAVQGIGDAMEDVIAKTNEMDGDEEKKLMRQYELLKHGTVFVEEIWDERLKKEKKINGNKKFSGKLNDVDWNTRIKKAFARPSRNIIPAINVYLGDITKYGMEEQPYVLTVDIKHYEEARLIFGEWERWKNVPRKIKQFVPTSISRIFKLNWRLLEVRDDYVEIIRYQDKWNNEFAIMLNGVLMTPAGLPLPWGYEDYNMAQQNLEPIHAKFAYGKSLVHRVRNKVAIYDEMLRLAILKTQKSFMPPYINISGRILSNRVLLPGKINHGIPKDTLIPINDKETQGVTTAEFNMIQELQNSINNDTTSPTFSGQQAEGNPTATEIIELQRQAKMVLGLTVFAASMLEWKLEWLRLKNLLANWFSPEDKVLDEARGILRDKFRTVSVEANIEGKGLGRRIIIPTKEMPTQLAVTEAGKSISEEQGMPVELVFVDADQIKNSKLIWQIVVRPKEKKTSETEKLLFRAFVADAMPLGPDPNYLRERFAAAWGEDPRKLFPEGSPMPGMAPEAGNGTLSPRTKLPTAEAALNRTTRTALGATA